MKTAIWTIARQYYDYSVSLCLLQWCKEWRLCIFILQLKGPLAQCAVTACAQGSNGHQPAQARAAGREKRHGDTETENRRDGNPWPEVLSSGMER